MQVDLAKSLKENRAAEIYIELKDSGTKVTDGYISATTQLDKDYQDYDKALRLAREQLKLYEGAVSTLDKKQFSLGSLNSRNKMEHDATMGNTSTRITSEDRQSIKDRILDAQR